MHKAGYSFIASFVLPEECWTDGYFTPRGATEQMLLAKCPGNMAVESYIEDERHEVELFAKYKQHYGYVFYVGKKR